MRNLFLASVLSIAFAPLSSRADQTPRLCAPIPLMGAIDSLAGACGMWPDGVDAAGDYTDG